MMKSCNDCGKSIDPANWRCMECYSVRWLGFVSTKPSPKKKKKHGTIYFLADEHRRVKIGFTYDMAKRLKTLQVGNADALTVLGIKVGSYKEEEEIQEKFSDLRIRDLEWFTLDEKLNQFIKENTVLHGNL